MGRQTMRNYTGLIDSLMAYVQNCVAANRCDDKVSAAPEGHRAACPPALCTPARTGRSGDGGGKGDRGCSPSTRQEERAGPGGLARHRDPRVLHALSLEGTPSPAPLSAVATGLQREPAPGHRRVAEDKGRGGGHSERLREWGERKEEREDRTEEGSR